MKRRRSTLIAAYLIALLAIPIAGQVRQEFVDLDTIARIREEGLQRSQVMQITSALTDGHGPRLTNSPNIKAAARWTMAKMKEWGLNDIKLEPWGPFGRGWTNERFDAAMVKPYRFNLIGVPLAWTPGTNGTVTGDVVEAIVATQADIEKYRGRLQGKFVLAIAPRDVTPQFTVNATRFTDEQLAGMANPAQQRGQRGGQQGGPPGPAGELGGQPGQRAQRLTVAQRNAFYLSEGVLGVIEHGVATGGNLVAQGGGSPAADAPAVPVQVVISVEHYNLMLRNVRQNIPVSIELNVENRFYSEDLNSFNIIGEIAGTDLADEAVIIGAHFDSWHAGTGATDNAAGCAVMLEAMRILKATGVPLRRTVRVALWTGEEQGLFGSAAYVRDHFADRRTMELKPEHGRMSVYFNLDNGTGQIRGVYLQGNEGARPVFEAWMQPFRDFGMTTLTMRGTGGTDHTNFDNVGLPGFQFIQDPIEYDSRTHHTSIDTYDRLVSKDMMQNAVIVASFVYQAANREELLPRKPLPPPQRGGRGGQ